MDSVDSAKATGGPPWPTRSVHERVKISLAVLASESRVMACCLA